MKREGFFTTKTLTTLAIFTALGYGLSWFEFPIFPPAPFLKLDFSSVVTLLAGYMYGICGSAIVEGIKQILVFLSHSDTAGVGQLANFLMTMAYVLPPILMYKRLKGKKWVVVGMSVGGITQILIALLCNRFITFPLYLGATASTTFNNLWYYIILFNLIKSVLISVMTFFIYKRLGNAIDKLFLRASQLKTSNPRPSGIFNTTSEQETATLAWRLAKTLKGGEVILLNGELGAGKTVFVRELAKCLNVSEGVVSPTFTLMNEYHGNGIRLIHIDAYRLNSGSEAYEAGLTEYFGAKDCVCCVEWANNISDAIVGERITVNINYTGENTREIEIK